MSDLRNEIKACFTAKRAPTAAQLVSHDGFDPFEKEDAVKFYSGKTWTDVLVHLNSLEKSIISGADFRLEEWCVLEPTPRYYFLRAYLEFLLDTLSAENPDYQFVSDLFHQLYQSFHMYEGEAFNTEQKILLGKLANYVEYKISNESIFPEQRELISDNIETFLVELEKHRVGQR